MEASTRSNTPTYVILGFVAVLVIVGLFLPPISLAQRLFQGGSERLSADSPQVSHPDGLTLSVDPAKLDKAIRVKLTSVPRADFGSAAPEAWQAAAAAMPGSLELLSPVYGIESNGDAAIPVHLDITIPNDAQPYELLDLYTWDGNAWSWAAADVDETADLIRSDLTTMPQGVAVVRANAVSWSVGLSAQPGETVPAEAASTVNELFAGGLLLGPNGALMGQAVDLAGGQYTQFATSASLDPAGLQTLLADANAQQSHISTLVNQVAANAAFAGLNLDYRDVTVAEKDAFTGLVQNLARQLHDAGKALVVTVPTPVQNTAGEWETAGYDWPRLAAAADRLIVTLPLDPTAYNIGGPVQQMLAWAVHHADRYRLFAGVNAAAVQELNGEFSVLATTEALASLGDTLTRVGSDEELEPGAQAVVEVSTDLLALDPASVAYHTLSTVNGQTADVWLAGGEALSHRLEALSSYHLGGVVINNLANSTIANELVSALNTYLANAALPGALRPSLTWAVLNESGEVLGELAGDWSNPQFAWPAVDEPGIYTILGKLAIGQQVADLGSVQVAVVASEPTATPTPEPTAEPSATPEGSGSSASDPNADAVVSGDLVNLREGPDTAFRVVAQLRGGTSLTINAVNPDKTWLKVTSADAAGWIFTQLCTVRISLNGLPVEEVELPTPVPTNTPDPNQPVVSAPPPSPSGGFELGGHIRTWNYLGQMGAAGMNWVKVQVHYGQDASGLVASAHGAGFKIQLSALGTKDMVNQANFHSDYSSWVAGMAAAGADAIEVWNEPNIDAEWPLGQISPTAYTQLLCSAYSAIKNSNGGTAVISAAPAPTGYFGGCSANGCDDLPWLQGLVNAGAVNCMDYVGAHHNAGATSPSATSGHPADGGGGHHSWYFLPQTQLYYNVFGGARKLFYTEMGYASQEGVPTFSDWFSWARGIDNAEQAAWLAEAVQLSRSTGMVRCIIVWNIDFARYGDDPQDGYAIIRPGGGCPACSSLASAMGY